MHTLATLGQDRPLSDLTGQHARYTGSGEINSEVPDPAATRQALGAAYTDTPGAQLDWLDGLTVTFGKLWFNLRRPTPNPCCVLTSKDPTPPR
jgi:phosphomannomutase